jgi:hypothetical protein
MRMLLGRFNANVARENILKPTIGNDSLHEISNDNGVTTLFTHGKIHKCTWTSPDGKTHNQTDHILIDKRWHSNIADVRTLTRADCGTDHYLVVAKVRHRL